MLAQIEVKNCIKKYNDVCAVKNVTLSVYKGEFLVIIGPSGCGKSTLLRCIAGLETPNEGEIVIQDEIVFSKNGNINIPTEKREVSLVFQNYALWPHYDVFNNVAYPLKVRRKTKEKIKKEVIKHLDIVQIKEKMKRYPHELSGGEQQRVALARALITTPKALLLDEPLSNLDAKLREQMQIELVKIKKELSLTVIHVTHDQSEAMELADRIIVMNEGIIEQIGTPQDIYNNPISIFVANFIGKTNIIKSGDENDKELFNKLILRTKSNAKEKQALSIRPEEISLSLDKREFKGEITRLIYHGSTMHYLIKYKNTELIAEKSSVIGINVGAIMYFTIGKIIVLGR